MTVSFSNVFNRAFTIDIDEEVFVAIHFRKDLPQEEVCRQLRDALDRRLMKIEQDGVESAEIRPSVKLLDEMAVHWIYAARDLLSSEYIAYRLVTFRYVGRCVNFYNVPLDLPRARHLREILTIFIAANSPIAPHLYSLASSEDEFPHADVPPTKVWLHRIRKPGARERATMFVEHRHEAWIHVFGDKASVDEDALPLVVAVLDGFIARWENVTP